VCVVTRGAQWIFVPFPFSFGIPQSTDVGQTLMMMMMFLSQRCWCVAGLPSTPSVGTTGKYWSRAETLPAYITSVSTESVIVTLSKI
jgi:hypothetical protein